MLPIILKIVLCSSLFIAVYHLFLEKEKIYRFNRAYLLGSLILSYVIPFITITIQAAKPVSQPQLIFEETAQNIISTHAEPENFNWINIIWLLYAFVTLILLIKGILAFVAIKRIQGKEYIYQNQKIILTQENLAPFSFLNTIYMGKMYVKNNEIDPRIFLHEKSHLDQKHSIDLIFIDFLKIFTWFNPILFLYRRAAITNHEFLADEAVLNKRFNRKEYQNLILDEIINSQNWALTHSFNFNNTKKRFIMMNAQKTKLSLLKKTAGITVLITSVALFSEKTYANEVITIGNNTLHHKVANVPDASTPQQQTFPTTSTADLQKEKVSQDIPTPALAELKNEKLKTIQDTIAPKAKTENNEGRNTNTNTSVNSNSNKDMVEAQFPGGSRELRAQIGNNMNTAIMESLNGTITSTAYLHIDETGKTTNITTSGNDEVFNKEFLRTITAITHETKWKPATKNGIAVATVLKIPATMTFTKP